MGTNRPGTEDSLYLKQSRWHWSDHPMANGKTNVGADCIVSACSPLLSWYIPETPIKGYCPLTARRWERVSLWAQVCLLLHLHIAVLQNKANFPFHQPCLFIGFWTVSSQTPLSATLRLRVNQGTQDLWCGQKTSTLLSECYSLRESIWQWISQWQLRRKGKFTYLLHGRT